MAKLSEPNFDDARERFLRKVSSRRYIVGGVLYSKEGLSKLIDGMIGSGLLAPKVSHSLGRVRENIFVNGYNPETYLVMIQNAHKTYQYKSESGSNSS